MQNAFLSELLKEMSKLVNATLKGMSKFLSKILKANSKLSAVDDLFRADSVKTQVKHRKRR